jgi:hypothetical protein
MTLLKLWIYMCKLICLKVAQSVHILYQGVTTLEKVLIDSPLKQYDLAMLHRLDVWPLIAHRSRIVDKH